MLHKEVSLIHKYLCQMSQANKGINVNPKFTLPTIFYNNKEELRGSCHLGIAYNVMLLCMSMVLIMHGK
jgi:hypothetical protein